MAYVSIHDRVTSCRADTNMEVNWLNITTEKDTVTLFGKDLDELETLGKSIIQAVKNKKEELLNAHTQVTAEHIHGN